MPGAWTKPVGEFIVADGCLRSTPVAGATVGVLVDVLGSPDPLDVGVEEELEDDVGSALAPSLPPHPLSSSARAAPHPIAVAVSLFNPRSFRRPPWPGRLVLTMPGATFAET